MICYATKNYIIDTLNKAFQTKLTYGMICYTDTARGFLCEFTFQTKLTYGMICYLTLESLLNLFISFKLS